MPERKLWVPESERIRQEESDRPKITCTEQQNLQKGKCPDCGNKIIVHCGECLQPVTGCACSMKKRIDVVREEMVERLFS